MITVSRYVVTVLAMALLAGCSSMGGFGTAEDSTESQAELALDAASVLRLQQSRPPEKRIPKEVIVNTKCIAVFPSIVKAGFIIGGRRGKGLISCRNGSGGWSQGAPAIYALTGGSIGFQAGIQQSSLILLFQTQESINTLMQNEFELGADIGVTAGPVGYHAHLASGAPGPVLAYMTSREGLFAGVSLNGSVMSFDQSANAEIYGTDSDPRSLLLSSHPVPPIMEPFSQALESFVPASVE